MPDEHVRCVSGLSQHELCRRLAAGAMVVLAVDPLEYHGPHLSLQNDWHISRGLFSDVAGRLRQRGVIQEQVLIDSFCAGVDPVLGPGTVSWTHAELVDGLGRRCESLVRAGCQRVILATFHGSPLHGWALERVAEGLRAMGVSALAPFNEVLRRLLVSGGAELLPAYSLARDVVSELPKGVLMDFHAGFLETSLSLHYCPDTVNSRYQRVPPCPEVRPSVLAMAAAQVARRLGAHQRALELEFAAYGLGWCALCPFPGYTGVPSAANEEAGAWVAERFVTELSGIIEDGLRDVRFPAPPMGWLVWLTMGGRLDTMRTTAPLLKVEL